jgi:hypothetical protein
MTVRQMGMVGSQLRPARLVVPSSLAVMSSSLLVMFSRCCVMRHGASFLSHRRRGGYRHTSRNHSGSAKIWLCEHDSSP